VLLGQEQANLQWQVGQVPQSTLWHCGVALHAQDMSAAALKMVELAKSLNQSKTANHLISVWHGSMSQQVCFVCMHVWRCCGCEG